MRHPPIDSASAGPTSRQTHCGLLLILRMHPIIHLGGRSGRFMELVLTSRTSQPVIWHAHAFRCANLVAGRRTATFLLGSAHASQWAPAADEVGKHGANQGTEHVARKGAQARNLGDRPPVQGPQQAPPWSA